VHDTGVVMGPFLQKGRSIEVLLSVSSFTGSRRSIHASSAGSWRVFCVLIVCEFSALKQYHFGQSRFLLVTSQYIIRQS
jgi:hypothetical protein